MNKLKNFFSNFSFNALFMNKKSTLIISLIISVIVWFITVGVYDPEASVIIKDVSISADSSNSQIQNLGLVTSSINPSSISVSLIGPRYKLARLTKDDINVYPTSIAAVTSADTYDIRLTADLKVPQSDIHVSLLSPNTSSFTFDTVSSKTLNLTAQAPNIKVDAGYILESPVPQPESLTVEGPAQSISQLNEIKLVNDSNISLNNTKTFDASLVFISNDGNEMDGSVFKYNQDLNFKITVPVFKQKQIPLTFKYKNAPSGLDLSKLKYDISSKDLNIAGATDAIENITEINLGYIDIRQLDIGKSFSFNIPIPSGFKNLDDIDTATVSFDSSNWSSKTLSVSDIQTSNIPPNYDINIISSNIKNIKIIGFSNEIDNTTSADITATIDFTNQTIQEGKQSVSVSIGILSKSGVWAVGDYTCIVNANKK